MEVITNNLPMIGGAVAALVVLIVVFIIIKKRKKKASTADENAEEPVSLKEELTREIEITPEEKERLDAIRPNISMEYFNDGVNFFALKLNAEKNNLKLFEVKVSNPKYGSVEDVDALVSKTHLPGTFMRVHFTKAEAYKLKESQFSIHFKYSDSEGNKWMQSFNYHKNGSLQQQELTEAKMIA